jgi:hypothetical protein
MLNGDISNVSVPYMAFDIELVWSVPGDNLKKVAWLELAHLYFKTREYYRAVPGSIECMHTLSEFYHLLFIFIGPKSKWQLMKKLADATPYNQMVCVTTLNDLPEELRQFRILNYWTMMQDRRMMLPTISRQFTTWDEFKIAQP